MKRLVFILILILYVAKVDAQYAQAKSRIPEPVKVILLYTSSIVLDAAGDALCDSGHKAAGHFINAASTGILLVSPFVVSYDKSKWFWYMTTYVALRIAVFDYSYNATRGLPMNYIGSTSKWDHITGEMKPASLYATRVTSLSLGVVIPIKKMGSKR